VEWRDLLVALALVLVIEGLIPFAAPGRYRRLVETLGSIGERQLRIGGLALMSVGLGLLYMVRG
jgi:hypothetical protein